MRPRIRSVYAWEVRKLLAQKRTYIGIGAAALLPTMFVIVMSLQKGGPYDAPLGLNLRHTGMSLPLVVLNFTALFGAPLVAALVAGDIVATEQTSGTLKLILTRSLRRSQIITAKTLAAATYTVAISASLLVAGLIGGIAAWGFHPLVDLSGHTLSAGAALGTTVAALGLFTAPLLAITAFGVFLSIVTRNSAAAIVGTLVYQLAQEAIGGLVHVHAVKTYVLSAQFDAWHGLFRTPTDWTTITRSLWVSAIYAAIPLAAGYWAFARRQVAGD